jgi:hypothetical protein
VQIEKFRLDHDCLPGIRKPRHVVSMSGITSRERQQYQLATEAYGRQGAAIR